jgi:transketolase
MGEMTFNMGRLATLRDVVGKHMENMGKRYPKMIVLTADVSTSSRVNGFIERFPERSYNLGVAEQNLLSFAAGLAHEGFIPFAFTFAPFATMRACEQLRTDICYSNLPVRVMGNGAGYSNGFSGVTHCALEDCAITTSFPNMTVIEPGDPFQVAKVLEATMSWDGPVYVRMGREAAASLYPDETGYQIGKALMPKEGDDGAFIAAGVVVHHAVAAAKRIKEETGANIRVVDMHTIKPLDNEAVLDAARTGRIVCAQDHNIIGGLGYAVAAVLAEAGVTCNFKILGCPDKFVPLATPDFLYCENEYDAGGLYKHMKTMLS